MAGRANDASGGEPRLAAPSSLPDSRGARARDDTLWPRPAIVRSVEPESPGVATFRIEFQDKRTQEQYRVEPGQFNMIYVPGVGEVPISVSSVPDEGPGIGHTIRFIGRVTRRDRQSAAGLSLGDARSVTVEVGRWSRPAAATWCWWLAVWGWRRFGSS